MKTTKGIGTIDFNKITPMPENLNIECGSNTDDGINLYLTSYYGPQKSIHSLYKQS